MANATMLEGDARSVLSNDGTLIRYIQSGTGPVLVFVHGSLSTPGNYSELIADLSKHFTVCAVERRGFGEDPIPAVFCSQRDIDDAIAVLKKTGAAKLFGYSLGGIIALGAAAQTGNLAKLAVYEPPLFPSRAAAEPTMTRLNSELAAGKTSAALVTAMVGAQLGAPWFNLLPRWFLEFATGYVMTYGEKEGIYRSFRQLAPTLRHDGDVILEASGRQDMFARISAETLLMGGSKSSTFLKSALTRLEKIVPNALRTEIRGLEHGSAQNADLRGNPGPIALELIRFFD